MTYHAENLLLGQGQAVNVGMVLKGWIWKDLATLAWLNPTTLGILQKKLGKTVQKGK